jgi:hypothetical protein
MLKTVAAGAAGGLLGALAVWAIAGTALEKQLQRGATDLASGLDIGRSELESRLTTGRTQLRTQIRTEVQSQVPPVVRRELESTLRRYNITPTTGRQISEVLNIVDRLGII